MLTGRLQPIPAQLVLTGDDKFVRITQLAAAWHRLHLDDLWRCYASAEATLESQSSVIMPIGVSLDGGVGGGGTCTGYWELVKGESEASILHKLVLGAFSPA